MTAETIRSLLTAAPFVPFTIREAGRPSMRVPHPDFAHVTPLGDTIFVWREDGKGYRMLDVSLISDLEPEGTKSRRRKTRGN